MTLLGKSSDFKNVCFSGQGLWPKCCAWLSNQFWNPDIGNEFTVFWSSFLPITEKSFLFWSCIQKKLNFMSKMSIIPKMIFFCRSNYSKNCCIVFGLIVGFGIETNFCVKISGGEKQIKFYNSVVNTIDVFSRVFWSRSGFWMTNWPISDVHRIE